MPFIVNSIRLTYIDIALPTLWKLLQSEEPKSAYNCEVIPWTMSGSSLSKHTARSPMVSWKRKHWVPHNIPCAGGGREDKLKVPNRLEAFSEIVQWCIRYHSFQPAYPLWGYCILPVFKPQYWISSKMQCSLLQGPLSPGWHLCFHVD